MCTICIQTHICNLGRHLKRICKYAYYLYAGTFEYVYYLYTDTHLPPLATPQENMYICTICIQTHLNMRTIYIQTHICHLWRRLKRLHLAQAYFIHTICIHTMRSRASTSTPVPSAPLATPHSPIATPLPWDDEHVSAHTQRYRGPMWMCKKDRGKKRDVEKREGPCVQMSTLRAHRKTSWMWGKNTRSRFGLREVAVVGIVVL